MPDYRRYRVPGGTYFFTVNLLERRLDTLVRQVDALREAVRVTRRERPFHIDAWVVLPDHMHYVWTLPPGDDDFSNRWSPVGWAPPTFTGGATHSRNGGHVPPYSWPKLVSVAVPKVGVCISTVLVMSADSEDIDCRVIEAVDQTIFLGQAA